MCHVPFQNDKYFPKTNHRLAFSDFFGTEKSITNSQEDSVKIILEGSDGSQDILKDNLELLAEEVIDTACMDMSLLEDFLNKEIKAAKEEGLLFSLHMKATMMKVSDPIIFGKCVSVFYASIFEKYGKELEKLGVDVNNGSGNLFAKIKELPMDLRGEVESEL